MTNKFYAYFDNTDCSNLTELSFLNDQPWLTFNNLGIFNLLKTAGFNISSIEDYQGFGIYLINVREDAFLWSGAIERNPKNILYRIPKNVINLARQKKIIIVIDNNSEGRPFIYQDTNALNHIHNAMKRLKLPKYSVIIANGNRKFYNEYDAWRAENFKSEQFAHTYMLTGFYYFDKRIPKNLLIEDAIKNTNSVDFNSLNRTVRSHRIEHLYMIIKNNWHKNNLVSGSYYDFFDNKDTLSSCIINVDDFEYRKLLSENCPLEADGNWITENPDISNQHIFNHDLYKNSLLSVVTETAFSESGMFITEKSFKPIVAGHPFMILGQPFLLAELKKMGYQTDFFGIDQRYDQIINTRERFIAFHNSLKKWIEKPRYVKIKEIQKSLPLIEHNRKVFLENNYEINSYKGILDTVKRIHRGKFRIEKD
jgi:hypothetical protein